MRYMIDTNIILDVFLAQEPFLASSKAVLDLCESRGISGFISASSATDLFYVVRSRLHSTEKAYEALGHVLNIVGVMDVTGDDVQTAFLKKARDFEDCLLAVCARSGKCDAIVTRNTRDFDAFDIPLLTPEELLAKHKVNKLPNSHRTTGGYASP